jgi:hypothetical protein
MGFRAITKNQAESGRQITGKQVPSEISVISKRAVKDSDIRDIVAGECPRQVASPRPRLFQRPDGSRGIDAEQKRGKASAAFEDWSAALRCLLEEFVEQRR